MLSYLIKESIKEINVILEHKPNFKFEVIIEKLIKRLNVIRRNANIFISNIMKRQKALKD